MIDPYVYPGTDILVNKYHIKDETLLKEMEAEFTSFRLKQMLEKPLVGFFDYKHFCKYHEWIFQDVYDWAGASRTVDIEKPEPALGGLSIEYSSWQNLESEAKTILNDMHKVNWKLLNIDGKSEKLSQAMADLWKVHPFREGNTRTVVTFVANFAEQRGVHMDVSLFEKNALYLRTALVAANANFHDLGDKSNKEYLFKIVQDSLIKGFNLNYHKNQELDMDM